MNGKEKDVTVRRIVSPEQGQEFTDIGWPELADESGCVWLAPHVGSGKTVTLWTPDGKTTTIEIPGRSSRAELVSAGKGRVFAVVRNGLQELVADNAAQPTTYRLGKLYALDNLDDGDLEDMQYSSLGYIVAISKGLEKNKLKLALRLYSLDPKSSEQAHIAATSRPATSAAPPPRPRVAGKFRTWHDASGEHAIQAALVWSSAGKVRLRKENGTTIDVPLEKLSDEDQEYIRNR